MQRANSNNTLDLFMKRQVDVKSSNVTRATESSGGNATEAAIAKVHRSAVNGRPTMKRTGSFTKSAQSPKRAKRSTSVLSHGETGTVVLRRETIPNPQITPRTSMNRFLGTNIFDDYSEVCMVGYFGGMTYGIKYIDSFILLSHRQKLLLPLKKKHNFHGIFFSLHTLKCQKHLKAHLIDIER
jgi:hypothetical protein